MKILLDLIIIVLPVMLSGGITFLITKYTYNRNRPLDKLEKAYDRVYYPLYKMTKQDNLNANDFIDKSKIYFQKYDKYIDRSTHRAYKALCESNTETKKKIAYENLVRNICNRSSFLRIRLGYLEPSFLLIYTYSTRSEKSTIRILFEGFMMYTLFCIYQISEGKTFTVIAYAISILFLIVIIELIFKFILFIFYKILK